MRILWVKMGGLWPATTGGRVRSLNTIAELARRHQVTVITTHGHGDDPEGLKQQLAHCERVISIPYSVPKHGSGASVLTAVSVPSQYYLGSALVDQKTNEIPVARELFKRLELEERLVSLDALHTQDETARALVLEHGADYLLTVKGNQPTVRQQIETLVEAPRGDFPP